MAADILRRARLVRREVFDPTNEEHVASFKVYLATGGWGEIQFYPEDPFNEAPATVMTKFARHALSVTAETTAERGERLKTRNIMQVPVITAEEATANKAAALLKTNKLMQASLGFALPAAKDPVAA